MAKFPLAVPTAIRGADLAHKMQVNGSRSPVSTMCFCRLFESQSVTCKDIYFNNKSLNIFLSSVF